MDLSIAAKDTRILDKRRDALRVHLQTAFALFDRDANGTCDVREVGTIVRSLGVSPSQRQFASMLEEMEDDEPTGFIRFDKFEKVVLPVIVENEYKGEMVARHSEDELLRAFKALDPEGHGWISADTFRELMSTTGEKLTSEEIEEMMNVCIDPETGNVVYDEYCSILAED
jgi:Ca2+-binding EF-hand superfamily protein